MTVQKYTTLADCVALAEFAHRNQTDKAGFPYITHPRRVMKAVQEQGAAPYVQMAAILHDVTEDTSFTTDMLLSLGVPEAAVTIVKLVDRDASERLYRIDTTHRILEVERRFAVKSDFNHIDRDAFYYAQIKKNPGAVQVKMADIGDNLQPWRLSYLPDETQDRLRSKYTKAIELLS